MLIYFFLRKYQKGGGVRDLTLNKWLLALLVALLPLAANAAGLGRLNVLSALGQPFAAEVELVSVSKEDLATLTVQLATPDAYRQAKLQYGSALSSLRFTVETRAGERPYIKIVSSRPVNEPFLDLLLELNWASGRIVREYTALLDPPGLGPVPAPVAPIAVPQVQPAPEPTPRIEAAPVATPPRPAAAVGTYGPIQRGETLGKIAGELKPEGVTLEQMMIGLQRSNPDAFIRNNVNLVKAGKILKVPEKEELAAISQAEATKEYRAQVTDWNSYRQRLADTAGTATETRTAASGKITTSVEDQAGAAPKDVVRLSKGEPPGAEGADGKPRSAAERLRVLQEEAVSREKALSEANERIVQLEKTIKDMQKLVELKGGPAVTKPEPTPEAKPAVKAEPAPKAEMAETKGAPAEAKKEEPVAAPAEKPAEKPEVKPEPKPKPKPKVAAPPPEPELMDVVMDNLPVVGGGLAVVLLGAGYVVARRRRSQGAVEPAEKAVPKFAAAPEPEVEAGASGAEAPAAAAGQEVDPLAEAEVYMAYGRDTQAEEILKEAMAREPSREDVQLKLLEIYSARKDKSAFGDLAKGLNGLTGGHGDNWVKAAAMGFALDPGNALYEAGRDVAASQPAPSAATTDFDFNLDAETPETDVTLEAGGGPEAGTETLVESETLREPPPEAAEDEFPRGPLTSTDISFEVPETLEPGATDIELDAGEPEKTGAAQESGIDFSVELPKLDDDTQAESERAPAEDTKSDDSGLDFKLDLGDIKLDTGEEATPTVDTGKEKDAHWYDVQTKFDLAKAYQEMGDKDGAKEILQEVIKEGDAEQQSQAKQLLETLG